MLWGNSADLRWTHDKNQRVFTFGRRLEDVVTDLRRGIFLPSELCMIRNVHWRSKWYSCNNRRLCCFREAAVITMQDRVGSNKRAFLHGLTTRTDGLSVVFPLSVCKASGEEFVNRKSCTTTTRQKKVVCGHSVLHCSQLSRLSQP